MVRHVVIGVDAGGTTTRCVAVARDGRVLGSGRGGGANPFSSADPAAALEAALRAALAEAGDVAVDHAVFGIAGSAEAGRPAAEVAMLRAWAAVGLGGRPRLTDDIAVAFAAGSAADAGAVLIAGTGAVAAFVHSGAVAHRCDGYGWLLGDEGSAVWLAVAGLRAALAAMDGRGPGGPLGARLAAALDIPAGDPQAIVRAAHGRPPAELGALAPVVAATADDGDPVAAGIVAEAAERLLATLGAVMAAADPVAAPQDPPGGAVPGPPPRAGAGVPIVLAGTLLARGRLAEAVRAGVTARYGAAPTPAVEGARGAAGLALRDLGAPADAHAALLRAGAD
ncbi:N-acetylglucosamine kinase [Streptomonospora sp. S1-112]|uniref:N-acetylglucosamine kinase n=1 Tax=Streptomonospora mangrovi TaxID=2883123 RepID=A0A9X3NS68_9ACTN|nr:BadF/BadG/BcrA/BcrD ATPase family protein [Streptomonospora mangrovi]MDA0563121.1 N-acetylglucosamine kinase [Streptomonospora mangrovi]